MAVAEGFDPSRIEEAGWGVIFPADPDGSFVPQVKAALQPLLDLRREQAGDHFWIYEGVDALRPGETRIDFLVRHRVPPADPADPNKMPYYLLLVGNPQQISYGFQSQFDVQYAVGRVYFETFQEYANYAASVIAAETGQVLLPKDATFFSVMNDDDPVTGLATTKLMEPLLTELQSSLPDWHFHAQMRQEASKAQLTRLLGGDATPTLLMASSHGTAFPRGSSRQIAHQGALLCQDWPGPREWRGQGAIPQEHYFAGDDLPHDANLLGMISLFFASYSGGTPQHDDFSKPGRATHNQVAERPFVSRLPMRMLSQEHGGALAVIGHIERAWGNFFAWSRSTELVSVFSSTLINIMEGEPVGLALENFNSRYATWATELSTTLRDVQFGLQVEPVEIASMWTAHNDARGFAIIGDPAVRLPLQQTDREAPTRPTLNVALIDRPRHSNGINAEHGTYEIAPMTSAELFASVRGLPEPENLSDLRYRSQTEFEEQLGVAEGIDPRQLQEAGWGIIFSAGVNVDATSAIKAALRPLLDRRRKQAGGLFRVYAGIDGLQVSESKTDFLGRHGVPPASPADPEKMPYYLLLVGDPEEIPYEFQAQLGIQYAVGRIHFETVKEYANYAANVVKSEIGATNMPKRAAFFGAEAEDGQETATLTHSAVGIVADELRKQCLDCQVETYLRDHASKPQLARLFGGDQTPALLFAAAHGMVSSADNPQQQSQQGALLCQNGSGPAQWQLNEFVPPEGYFAGNDLSATADLSGRIALLLASYSVGAPTHSRIPVHGASLEEIAPRPFTAELPQRMLGIEKGALAVIGYNRHIWGAWTHGMEAAALQDIIVKAMAAIMQGDPVGLALEQFKSYYARQASELSSILRDVQFGLQLEPSSVADRWMAAEDAAGLIILGDPAVRLPCSQV